MAIRSVEAGISTRSRGIEPNDLLAHGEFVRKVARAILRREDGVDDIVQQTWVAALQRPPCDRTGLRAWLGAVARNLARMGIRGERRRRQRERVAARIETDASTLDSVARLEWQQRVVTAVRELPEPYRSTLLARYYDGLRPGEVACKQDVSVATVRNRSLKAFALLRERLQREHGAAWSPALFALVGVLGETFPQKTLGVLSMASTATKASYALVIGVGVAALVIGVTMFVHAVATQPPEPSRAGTQDALFQAAEPPQVAPEGKEPAPSPKKHGADPSEAEKYLRRINEATVWADVTAIGIELAKLPPKRGRDVLVAIFGRIERLQWRKTIHDSFLSFIDGKPHPHAMDVVHLAATDETPSLRAAAFQYLLPLAFADFTEDPQGYAVWRERVTRESVQDAIRAGVREFVHRLAALPEADALGELERIPRPDPRFSKGHRLDIPGVLREAGFLALAEKWITSPSAAERKPKTEADWLEARPKEQIWRWLESTEPPGEFLRRNVLPILEADGSHGPIHTDGAIRLLGRSKADWAFDALFAALMQPGLRHYATSIGTSMSRLRRKNTVPYFIAALLAVDDADFAARVGTCLAWHTGVKHEKDHDAAWWLTWWDENRARLPRDTQALDPRTLHTK